MATGWVYDIETLQNCFVAVFINYKDRENTKIFVIHELRNDFSELMEFLDQCIADSDRHIGFNVLGFDAQIIEAMLKHRSSLEKLDPEQITAKIYKKAQDLISLQDFGDKFSSSIIKSFSWQQS